MCSVCVATIEDHRADSQEAEALVPDNDPRPWLNHPLASTLKKKIESWIHQESLGNDGLIALNDVRVVASQVMHEALTDDSQSRHNEVVEVSLAVEYFRKESTASLYTCTAVGSFGFGIFCLLGFALPVPLLAWLDRVNTTAPRRRSDKERG